MTTNNKYLQDLENELGPETLPIDSEANTTSAPTKIKSQATRLVELAHMEQIKLFCTPGDDATGYVSVPVDGHWENLKLKSNAFREWLRRLYWENVQAAPNSQSLTDATGVLTGQALYSSPEYPVDRRIAGDKDCIWVDLRNAKWQAVKVTTSGWEVVDQPDVNFIRRRGMLELPVPKDGGSLDELRSLVNVRSDEDWILVLAWLVAAFRPNGPYPILGLNGEQGSAKSTTSRMLRALVDPNKAPLRSEPKEPRDLMITANNAWMLAFDNLSSIGPIMSDALCRLSTGGGFATRELYSDDEECVFDSMRPVLINGITELSTRPDLLDRTISITLPTIPERDRRTESAIWNQFHQLRPGIFGALLDAVVIALNEYPRVQLPKLPRMADFATWSVAAESAFGLGQVSFFDAYETNRELSNESAIQSCLIANPLTELMTGRTEWKGTASQLLDELSQLGDERVQKQKAWPKLANGLSGQLRRIAPNLRRMGYEIELDGEREPKTRRKLIRISTVPEKTVQTVRTVQTPQTKGSETKSPSFAERSHADNGPFTDPGDRSPSFAENHQKQGENANTNAANGLNDEIPSCSNEEWGWDQGVI